MLAAKKLDVKGFYIKCKQLKCNKIRTDYKFYFIFYDY